MGQGNRGSLGVEPWYGDEVPQKLKRLLETCSEFLVLFIVYSVKHKDIGEAKQYACPTISLKHWPGCPG